MLVLGPDSLPEARDAVRARADGYRVFLVTGYSSRSDAVGELRLADHWRRGANEGIVRMGRWCVEGDTYSEIIERFG